jgi:nicotinamidase-related amidase
MPFPLDHRAVHLCIDMQRLFAEASPWHVPWMPRILPQIVTLAEWCPARTIFSRFIPPATPDEAQGAWRDYYNRWQAVTREHLDSRLLDLLPPLAALAPPARVIDKAVYSALGQPAVCARLRRDGVTTVIVTGGETDVCVLSTVMDAVDAGFRVVLPTDALCSVSDKTHDALLALYRERFSLQIETTTVGDILARWNCR